MACVAAHTGARRSELLRMEAGDVDLDGGEVTFRERKRVRSTRTTRRVTLTPLLRAVLADWMAVRPACKHLFAQSGHLPPVGRGGPRPGTNPRGGGKRPRRGGPRV